MKLIKLLFAGIGMLLLLVIIAVAIFLATFDANEYKQNLSQLVEQQTGRQLGFEGDIGLTLYPALGMKLGSMHFANAKGFDKAHMLAVNEASVSVDVLSLLSFSPKIDQLVLDGLTLNLQKNKQGQTNWDDLVAAEKTPSDVKTTEPKKDKQASGLSALAGSFGGLNITRANLLWKDDSSAQEYRVQDLSLQSGAIQLDQAFPVELNMVVHSPGQLQSTVSLSSRVTLQAQKILLSSLQLKSNASGSMIPFNNVELNLSGDVDFGLENQQLSIQGFSTALTGQGGAMEKVQAAVAGEIGFDLSRQLLTVGMLDVTVDLIDPGVPAGQLKTVVSASQLQLALTENAVELKDLKLALNEERFEGIVKVHDYTRPAVDFTLRSDSLNLDRLMGENRGPDPQPAAQPEPAAEDVQISLPMEILRSLQLNGKLQVDKLIAQKLTFTDVLLQVAASDGVIDLKPISLDLYDGHFDGAVQIDAQGQQPQYRVSQKLSSFQVGQFLKDFMGDDMLSGNANLEVNLRTQGEWLSQLKSSLDGDMNIMVKDGALKGFNLRHELDAAKAKLKGQKVPEQNIKKTDFSALSISGVIKQGVFTSEDLKMQAPLLRVGGKGSADLANETVDYLVNAKLVGTIKGQQGGEADELSGLEVPVAITGPWLSPEIDVQLDEMMKAKLNAEKARLAGEAAKQKARVQQQLNEEKAKLKAAQERKLAAEKARLKKQQELAEAERKAELEAKKQAEKEKAKKKLEEKLKNLF